MDGRLGFSGCTQELRAIKELLRKLGVVGVEVETDASRIYGHTWW